MHQHYVPWDLLSKQGATKSSGISNHYKISKLEGCNWQWFGKLYSLNLSNSIPLTGNTPVEKGDAMTSMIDTSYIIFIRKLAVGAKQLDS